MSCSTRPGLQPSLAIPMRIPCRPASHVDGVKGFVLDSLQAFRIPPTAGVVNPQRAAPSSSISAQGSEILQRHASLLDGRFARLGESLFGESAPNITASH